MLKIISTVLLLLGIIIPSIVSGAIAKEGLIIPIYRHEGNQQDLALYYFNEAVSKFNIKIIAEKVTAYQAFPDGTIYCIVKSPTLYREKVLPDFGLKLIFINEPNDLYKISSGIAINIDTNDLYFTKQILDSKRSSVSLCKLNFKTGKESRLTAGDKFYFIGIPALSPDKKKIAFYCAITPYCQLQVAFYDIKNKLTKIIAPPSVPILPCGPEMGGAPAWNNKSSEIYFMANYPKTKIVDPGAIAVYKKTTSTKKKIEWVCAGGLPMRANNGVSCTFIDEIKKSRGIIHISPPPKKLIYRNAVFGKFSPSGSLIAFKFKSGFYAGKIANNDKLLLANLEWPDATWIKLKPNNITSKNRHWYLSPAEAIMLAKKSYNIEYDKSVPLIVKLYANIYNIGFTAKVRRNDKGEVIHSIYAGWVKIDAQSGKVLQKTTINN